MFKQVVTLADGRQVIAKFTNPQPLLPLNADNADFTDYGDRATLAHLGIFSIDRAGARCLRRLEALRREQISDAYTYLGLDKRAEHGRVAGEVMALGLVPDGCWPTSTGAYARRRDELDAEVLASARRVRVTEQYFIEIAGDEVCTAVFALGA